MRAGDESLNREVESLLAEADERSPLDQPVWVPADLCQQTRLSRQRGRCLGIRSATGRDAPADLRGAMSLTQFGLRMADISSSAKLGKGTPGPEPMAPANRSR
jgi:hypothetical protein